MSAQPNDSNTPETERLLTEAMVAHAALVETDTINPKHAAAYVTLARLFNACGRSGTPGAFEKAGLYASAALDGIGNGNSPDDTPRAACLEIARALMFQHRLDEAIALYRSLVQDAPNDPDARWSLATCLGLRGEFGESAAEIARADLWRSTGMTEDPAIGPEWRGEDLTGKTILAGPLYGGGRGDLIQYVRFAPELVARGACVVWPMTPELIPLLCNAPGVSAVTGYVGPCPPYDIQVNPLKLPALLGTIETAIPNPNGYLFADPYKVTVWAARLATARLKVGLVWAGGATHVDDEWRSMTFASLAPMLSVADVQFVSLQVGPHATEAHGLINVFDASPWLTDYAQTAAAIANLDVVVTVDTSVAHLAGALGKTVCIMLAHTPDGRWRLTGDESAWYARAVLWRQSRPGDWTDVVEGIAAGLVTWVQERAAGRW